MSFDARDPGTASGRWTQDPRYAAILPAVPPGSADAPVSARDLVVLAAHPDDETLGAGGLIATARAAGHRVTVVLVTDGRASHPVGLVDPAALADVREREFHAALALLGAPEARSLGHLDGSVREEADAIEREIGAILDALSPGEGAATTKAPVPPTVDAGPLLVAPWRGDGHRDHRVLGEIAARLAADRGIALWEYPIWLWHWGDPDHVDVPWALLGSVPLDEPSYAAKRAALDAYVSQTTPRGDQPPQLHGRFLANFERREEVFVVRPAVNP